MQPDPLGISQGNNLYAYVENEPLNSTDPMGLFKVRARWPGSLVSKALHETIVFDAFKIFNSQNGNVFSNYMIDLFIAGNIRTDLIFDSGHQFNSANHFDNPNDTRWNNNSGGPTWIASTIASIQGKRNAYSGSNIVVGCTLQRRPLIDIRNLIESFGSNTHTIGDFYAHSNWVDSASKGGVYSIERTAYNYGVFRESGKVPVGLQQSTIFDFDNPAIYAKWYSKLYTGNAEGCSTFKCVIDATVNIVAPTLNGPLYPRNEARYYHNVVSGKDSKGRDDKTTHAYWAKDEPGKQGYTIARDLAVKHVVEEIKKLWAKSSNNSRLRAIYGLDKTSMKNNNIIHISTDVCTLCPALGSWRNNTSR